MSGPWRAEFDVILTRWLRETKIARYFRANLAKLPNLGALLHANAVGFDFDASGRRIGAVRLQSSSGRMVQLKAAMVVIAWCGGGASGCNARGSSLCASVTLLESARRCITNDSKRFSDRHPDLWCDEPEEPGRRITPGAARPKYGRGQGFDATFGISRAHYGRLKIDPTRANRFGSKRLEAQFWRQGKPRGFGSRASSTAADAVRSLVGK
jgi:hypothetical protein